MHGTCCGAKNYYELLMRHAAATLDRLGLADDAREGLLGFLASFERDTVERR